MTVARFRVVGVFDGAGGATEGTVLIDRQSGIFYVRPKRRRRLYMLPLSTVAELVCKSIIFSELAEKRRAKRALRRSRGRR